MNKKLLLIIFAAVAVVASLFIGITIDPLTSQNKANLVKFHNNSEVVYLDGYFKDTLLPKVEDEAYKAKLTGLANKMASIVEKEIDPHLIQDLTGKGDSVIQDKSNKALAGINKLLKVVKEAEAGMPVAVKTAYNAGGDESGTAAVKKLITAKKLIESEGLAGKVTLRLILILVIAIAAGVVFVLIERKARETGEIQAADVA